MTVGMLLGPQRPTPIVGDALAMLEVDRARGDGRIAGDNGGLAGT
jgi:hypothetical protein